MAEYRQLVLVAVLLFQSNLTSAGTLSETGNNLHLEEGNDEEIRIVDSDFSERNQYPYMVALGKSIKGQLYAFCGGSLISSNQILTAAHCVTEKKTTTLLDVWYKFISHSSVMFKSQELTTANKRVLLVGCELVVLGRWLGVHCRMTTDWSDQSAGFYSNKTRLRIYFSDGAIACVYNYPPVVRNTSGERSAFQSSFHWTGLAICESSHIAGVRSNERFFDAKILQVFLGAHELSSRKVDAQLVKKVIKIKIHKKYNPTNWFNDIAILTLDSPVTPTKTISPICLPPQGTTDQYDGRLVIVKGWGSTKEGGSGSDFLKHVSKRIINLDICQHLFKSRYDIQDHMMCAYERGKGTCQGDSGGPLVVKSDRPQCKYEQVGVVSFGYGCARKAYPGIFMRVTSFLPWIKMNTNQ